MAWEVARSTGLPVIGAGGVATSNDALEFLLVGARAVAVASAVIADAQAAVRITEGLREYLRSHAIADINDIIGEAKGLA